MHTPTSAFPIDPRAVFKVYAVAAIALGVIGLDGNAMPDALGRSLQPAWLVLRPSNATSSGHFVWPRIAGAALLAAGLVALAAARLEHPADRQRLLNWFAVAHVLFGFLFAGVVHAILGSIVPSAIVWAPLVAGGLLAYFAITTAPDVPEAARSTDALRSEYERQIRQAARREERERMARDLHDAIKQQLFVIQTSAAAAEARLDTDERGARAAVDDVRAAARQAMTEMEALIAQLEASPMENTGLVEALRTQCEALGFRTGAEVQFHLGTLPDSETLPPGTQETLYRFAQEALANVARHARAQNVTVFLGLKDRHLELTIEDDGVGFDSMQPPGMGRRNMAARASELGGTSVVLGEPGRGTRVRCSVPYHVSSMNPDVTRLAKWILAGGVAGLGLFALGDGADFHLSVEFMGAFAATLMIAAGLSAVRWYLAYRDLRA